MIYSERFSALLSRVQQKLIADSACILYLGSSGNCFKRFKEAPNNFESEVDGIPFCSGNVLFTSPS